MRSFYSASFFPYPWIMHKLPWLKMLSPARVLFFLTTIRKSERLPCPAGLYQKISAAELPILANNESLRPGDIVINNADGDAALTEDGFHLTCSVNGLSISSAGWKRGHLWRRNPARAIPWRGLLR
ncbi:MAG: hypothetical protein H6561_13620 [Lewinellaceae bacterium]|nr:hypothetical protein [Lewinellaceae bacterium]